jgi:hypothetical protein
VGNSEGDEPGAGAGHPLNPDARLGPDGIWNDLVLPVMEREAPLQRVVVPHSLLHMLDPPLAPVLRWDAEKYLAVIARHDRDRHVCDNLSRYLDRWEYVGIEVVSDPWETRLPTLTYRVLLRDEHERWYAISMGSLPGSDNVITVIGSARKAFLGNRLRNLRDVQER